VDLGVAKFVWLLNEEKKIRMELERALISKSIFTFSFLSMFIREKNCLFNKKRKKKKFAGK
jgi:hypothetical protein